MRIVSLSHALFSCTLIVLGIIGLFQPGFVPVWNPVPANLPLRQLPLYLGALISLATGIGLLIPRLASIAARLLLATFLVWLLLFRLPNFLHTPAFQACWSVFPLAVMVAAAWVLYVWFAAEWDRKRLPQITGSHGLRISRMLYGLSLIFFGAAHFIDLQDTLLLIPHWLPSPRFWAWFTGSAFIAAGLAILIGLYARLAATLSALQIALFLLLIWIPILATGPRTAFQWSETILNVALFAGAWIVADSYTRLAAFNCR